MSALPERALEPDESIPQEEVDRMERAIRGQIEMEARDADYWVALFDDVIVPGVDTSKLGLALWRAYTDPFARDPYLADAAIDQVEDRIACELEAELQGLKP